MPNKIGAILVARKSVDRRVRVDPLTGEVKTDSRTSGASEADDSALEWALRLADAWDVPFSAVTVGPEESASVLDEAVALGADRAVRVAADEQEDSFFVARSIAKVARELGARTLVCGDASLDRGSGSVPAFVAGLLGVPQALGLVDLRFDPDEPGRLECLRRLDGARRERLAVSGACVISVEGATARLRRAPMPGMLEVAQRRKRIEVIDVASRSPERSETDPALSRTGPFRPRTHVVAAPDPSLDALGRVVALTGASSERTTAEVLTLRPEAAADRILEALADWGER